MSKYDSQEFVKKFNEKVPQIPSCPYCHGTQFTTTGECASILIGTDTSTLNIGPCIPAGMVICQKCGHIEFFALGTYGMLRERDKNGKQ